MAEKLSCPRHTRRRALAPRLHNTKNLNIEFFDITVSEDLDTCVRIKQTFDYCTNEMRLESFILNFNLRSTKTKRLERDL